MHWTSRWSNRKIAPHSRARSQVPAALWQVEEPNMNINRHTYPLIEGRPIISRVVEFGNTVYVCGTTPDPVGDISSQTKQVLHRIDHALGLAGTCKSKLLTAQVWLADMRLFEAHNAEWNAWVDP